MTPVSLVLWFKDHESSDTPIYTLDVRNSVSLVRSKHVSSVGLKDRAYFDVSLNPPRLVINNITKSDQGLFRCRVSEGQESIRLESNTSCSEESFVKVMVSFLDSL